MNLTILSGNVGSVPDVVNLDNGTKIASFSLATNENYKDKSGNWIEHTEWHNIKCFGYVAEKAAKIEKGAKVLISGKLKTESWENDGQKKYKTVVIADKLEMTAKTQSVTSDTPADYGQSNDVEDDFPF